MSNQEQLYHRLEKLAITLESIGIAILSGTCASLILGVKIGALIALLVFIFVNRYKCRALKKR